MKKLFIATMMLFAFTMTFAQNSENTFKKNEISVAPYTANLTYSNSNSSNDWLRTSSFNLLESNYRRYLNENTALRFGARVQLGFDSGFSILNIRAGVEKYLTLSPKFQLYGGAQLNLSTHGNSISMTDFSAHSVSVDLIGGVRYNINDKWSLSSEIISPVGYGWSSQGSSAWGTGVRWQPLKLNFRF